MEVNTKEYVQYGYEDYKWVAHLKPYKGDSINFDHPGVGDLMIWPAKGNISIIEYPSRSDLPWGMKKGVVKLAVDLNNDNTPDVLSVEFCCSDSMTDEGCEYYCTNYWIKEKGRWIKCYNGKPA